VVGDVVVCLDNYSLSLHCEETRAPKDLWIVDQKRLIHLTDHIRIQMAKGNYTGMVLLDLQKAFDTVDHTILCNKLEAMGIGSTNWFRSYLRDRTQRVKIGDSLRIHAYYLWSAAGKHPGSITIFMLCE